MAVRARVLSSPRRGSSIPRARRCERALPALGFTGVRNVHVGRLIELDVEDPARLPEMCERLLTNPLIEDYEIVETGSTEGDGSREVRRHPLPRLLRRGRRAARRAARRRGGDPVARRPRPARRRRGRRPRRLLLRRLPARRRDRPVRAGDGGGGRVRARRAGSCSGSATASRSCARRACCPGRCCRTPR